MSDLGRSTDAYQAFVLGTKLYWTRELYPALKSKHETKARTRGAPGDLDEVAKRFSGDDDYAYFAWFERHLQRMKYSGRYGLVPAHEPLREAWERTLTQDFARDLLALNPNLDIPKYFTAVDIHQHPGGVCGDSLAGVVYERGARTTTPLMRRDLDLHYRLVDAAKSYVSPQRVADLGCGFGKSTRPFYKEFPDVKIDGVDLSEPCLRLAAFTASQDQATNVRYHQATAQETGLSSSEYNLVTSTMTLHEMPPPAVEAMVEETYRLLGDGGYAVHLDFLADEDPFNRFIHYGHSKRNNEPYMPPLNEMDIVSLHERVGFKDVQVLPFEEFPGALDASNVNWRFPWALVVARK